MASHNKPVTTTASVGAGNLDADDGSIRRASVAFHDVVELHPDATQATDNEHKMTLKQALKLYPKAVAWSMLFSTAILMEGYDVALLSSFYALPQFNEKYGALADDGAYTIPAPWKSGLSNGALCGEILGLFATGMIAERLGYRKTMLLALTMMIAVIFVSFFAPSLPVLLLGEILCGIPWGAFQTLTTTYASEVCPVALRAYLCTYVNLCWVLGQLVASTVLRALLSRKDQWAYRIPFAIQWVWPLPILFGCIFAPESPWWLVRKGRVDEAKDQLGRLTSRNNHDFDADTTIAMMVQTNELEKSASEGTSYLDCFRGSDLRRTEIVCLTWVVQALCGSTFMGYSTYFYHEAGLPTKSAFDLSMGQYALGAIGTIGSWFLMARIGRRSIYLCGAASLLVLLISIGIASIFPSTNKGSRWAIGAMLLLFTSVYDLTVGPVCYALVAEMSSTRLKAKTIVLARNLYNVSGIIVNILTTYQLTPKPSGWGWGGKSAFFWAGTCAMCVIWIYFRLPEPKGRTYAEMDILFEDKVPARRFKDTKLDTFGRVPANTVSKRE